MEGFAGLILFAWVLPFVLVICWTLLPFAMIGIKPLLRELIQKQRKANELLAKSNSGEAPKVKRESWA